jgi:membrane protease YdiL (CAAX protease family)
MDNDGSQVRHSHAAGSAGGDVWHLPWGPVAGLGGLGLLVLGLFLVFSLMAGLGLDLDEDGARYAALLVQYGFFLLLPALVVVGAGGRAGDLGLRRAPAAAVGLGILSAPLVLLLVLGYHAAVQWVSPTLVETLEEEVRQQAAAFAAPLPLLVLLGVVVGPFCEELVFRGFLYGGLRTRLSRWPAAILSAVLFALSHQMPVAAPGLFVLGLLLAALYERYRSLAVPLALHASFNLLVLLLQQATT